MGEFLEVFNINTGLNLFCSLPIFIPRLHQYIKLLYIGNLGSVPLYLKLTFSLVHSEN